MSAPTSGVNGAPEVSRPRAVTASAALTGYVTMASRECRRSKALVAHSRSLGSPAVVGAANPWLAAQQENDDWSRARVNVYDSCKVAPRGGRRLTPTVSCLVSDWRSEPIAITWPNCGCTREASEVSAPVVGTIESAGTANRGAASAGSAQSGRVQRGGRQAAETAHAAAQDAPRHGPPVSAGCGGVRPGVADSRRNVPLTRDAIGVDAEQRIEGAVVGWRTAELRRLEAGAVGELQPVARAPRVAQVQRLVPRRPRLIERREGSGERRRPSRRQRVE